MASSLVYYLRISTRSSRHFSVADMWSVCTPLLMVLMMVAGDFFALSSATDNVRPSSVPNVWRIGNLTIVGKSSWGFAIWSFVSPVSAGRFALGLDSNGLRTLTVVTLVYSGQAIFYVSRERRHLWSSKPGSWLIASSILDITLFTTLATRGIVMAPCRQPSSPAYSARQSCWPCAWIP